MNKNKFLIPNFITVLIISLVIFLIPIKTQNETGFIIVFVYYLFFNILSSVALYMNTSSVLKKDILNISVIYIHIVINIITIIFLILSKIIFISTAIVLIITLLLTLITFLLLYFLISGNNFINKQEEKIENKTKVVNNWKTRIEVLLNNLDNEELKKDLTNLYELIRYMDPFENELTYELDSKINTLIEKLEKNTNSVCINELIKTINERKVIISNNK